jgi:hypothetical protein
MTHTFKVSPELKLINALNQHLAIKLIIELTGLSLEEIFANFSLEIPVEYEPNVGWLILWDPTTFYISPEHQDLVQIVLKFAWSYTTDSPDERLRAFLNNELTMFEAGMKLYSIHQQQIKASKKDRSWKALDNWIIQKLGNKKKWTQQELWDALPESYESKGIYREGDEIYCTKKSRNPIKFRAFCDHFRKAKRKIKYG